VGAYQEYAAAQLDSGVWNWIDFTVGFVTGAYGPLVQRVRNYDCFSEFFNWGSEFITWHVLNYGWW
jgi:hypothetical protein